MKALILLLAVFCSQLCQAQQHHQRQGGGPRERNKICCEREFGIDATLESPNHRFFLVFQKDRNVVIYMRSPGGDKALWATATNNRIDRGSMQADGNFVLYSGTRAIWSSNTYGNQNASLVMQDDGNLVIYTTDGRAIWATNTAQAPEVRNDSRCCDQDFSMDAKIESPNGRFFLVFQQDRNVVLYMRTPGGDKALWASATNNRVNRGSMQADGNFVLYSGPTAVWSSNTYGNPNASLVIQDDGNLVIYTTDGRAIWATNTVQADAMPAPAPAPVVVEVPAPAPQVITPVECSLTDSEFKSATAAIDAQAFRDARMKIAKLSIKGKCLSLDQIRTIARMFSFEDQTLEFLKYAYDFTNSKDQYFTLSDIFAFNSNTQDFTAFLEGK